MHLAALRRVSTMPTDLWKHLAQQYTKLNANVSMLTYNAIRIIQLIKKKLLEK